MTDAKIKHMVDRFLGWRLPENFNPDAGISFQKTFNENTPYPMKHEPTGTNLFDASQAEEMIRYMLAEPAATQLICGSYRGGQYPTGCALNAGHDGPHSDGNETWPATPQTTGLPPLPKPLSLSKHWDGGIEWRIAGERAARLEREDQLSSALIQLAALRTSRDALLVELTTIRNQVVNGRLCYFGDHTGYEPQFSSEQTGRWNAAIAAAQQLQEDGK